MGAGGGIHDREARSNTGEKGLSVVAAPLQMSDEPIFCVLKFTGQQYQQFYDLTIDRLSGKICTFAHVTSVYFATSKVTKEAEILQEGFSLIFCRVKLLPDSNNNKEIPPFTVCEWRDFCV